MNTTFSIALYRDNFMKIRRGSYKGIYINAKPILLLTIIKAIKNGIIDSNKIEPSQSIIDLYKQVHLIYESKITPFFKPFYYLQYEDFWHLKWKTKEDKTIPPSMAMIRTHIDYAYLDEELWELLQVDDVRDEFRQLIEDYYLR